MLPSALKQRLNSLAWQVHLLSSRLFDLVVGDLFRNALDLNHVNGCFHDDIVGVEVAGNNLQ